MNNIKEILAYNKETDRKFRWLADINGAKFELYIEKWRIPEPVPKTIIVRIGNPDDKFENRKKYKIDDIEKNPSLRNEPIFEIVKKTEPKTKTLRYTPILGRNDWEIGEPYIPFELIPDEPEELAIQIIWK